MSTVVSDLSPYYLAKARENIKYWKSQRVAPAVDLGGPDGAGVEYFQCPAEQIPAADNSFDVVSFIMQLIWSQQLPTSAVVHAADGSYGPAMLCFLPPCSLQIGHG